MKIDPSEKQQPIISPTTVRPVYSEDTKNNFTQILDDTVQKSSSAKVDQGGLLRPSIPPNITNQPVSGKTESRVAYGLLDALENYKALLEDPSANLKMVAPAVEKMRSLSKRMPSVLDQMDEKNPVKMVVKDALVHISKEIERFDMGYYVDD